VRKSRDEQPAARNLRWKELPHAIKRATGICLNDFFGSEAGVLEVFSDVAQTRQLICVGCTQAKQLNGVGQSWRDAAAVLHNNTGRSAYHTITMQSKQPTAQNWKRWDLFTRHQRALSCRHQRPNH
jgi:hypothetical protein